MRYFCGEASKSRIWSEKNKLFIDVEIYREEIGRVREIREIIGELSTHFQHFHMTD